MKKILSTVLLSTLLLTGCGDDEAKSDKKEDKTETNFYITGDLNEAGMIGVYVDKIGNVIYKHSSTVHTVPFKELTVEQVKILQKEGVQIPEELLKEKEDMQAKKQETPSN